MSKKRDEKKVEPRINMDVKIKRHLVVGWFGLLVFLCLGIGLEVLHGLKVDFYLGPFNQTRRFLWTLAHVHGTLFSILQIAFGLSIKTLNLAPWPTTTSICLTVALLLVPTGFFLGGLWFHGGDPGLGIYLVPIGAIALLIGVGQFCACITRSN